MATVTSSIVSIYAIGSLLPLSSSNSGRRFSFRPCFLVRRIENTDAESVEAIVDARSNDTGSDMANPTHDEKKYMNTPVTAAVITTPSVASTIPGARMGRISENLVSIPPEKRIIQRAIIPMNCVSSKDSNLMKCSPNIIPTPMKSNRAGAPKR